MHIAKTCNCCGRETEKAADLILVATFPEIKHFCRDCCEKKSIYLHPLHEIAFHLV